MSLDKKEVQIIANLSALNIDDAESTHVATQLSNILDLFEQIENIDTKNIKPMSNPLEQVQRLREDTLTELDLHAKYQKIAPATTNNLYLVPQVID